MKTRSALAERTLKRESTYVRLLASTFTDEEIAALEKHPHFQAAIAVTTSYDEFERTCEIGRRLLARRTWLRRAGSASRN
jgi:hypothetical protein